MKYSYKLDKCPKCETQSYNHEETKCCIECGETLINFCSSDNCEMDDESPEIPVTAKYCPFCGSESMLKAIGFFDKE